MNKANNVNTKREDPALQIKQLIEHWKGISEERNIQSYPVEPKYLVYIDPNDLDGRPLSAKEIKNREGMYARFQRLSLW